MSKNAERINEIIKMRSEISFDQVELLAPAGSYEAFEAAIAAGADAVYLGGSSFGARAYAQNFTEEQLLKAIDFAHLHDRKLYLTLNTLLKNREMEQELYEFFRPYYEQGLDAVIVQDLGVAEFLKSNFPKVHLHASTQMTVTGPESMIFLESKGFTRVVPARELSLAELKQMHQASPIEIEVFIHGALCYCYSGQCLLSSMLGGRSGNRGRCAQPCRLNYDVYKDHKKAAGGICPLSPRDMCTIDLLPEILSAGAISLKIEGRMKNPGYSGGVVSIYRKYLDLLRDHPEDYEVLSEDREKLLGIFSRGGSCEGYFKQYNGPKMMDFRNEKKTSGMEISIPKISKRKVSGELELFVGKPARLHLKSGDVSVVVEGEFVQEAQKQPMEKERILQQMNKLGQEEFSWENLELKMDEHIFMPVKFLNEIRRNGLDELRKEMLSQFRRRAEVTESQTVSGKQGSVSGEGPVPLYASCLDQKQFQVLIKMDGLQGIYAPFEVLRHHFSEIDAQNDGMEYYLALPYIQRKAIPSEIVEFIKGHIGGRLAGILVRCLETYSAVKELGFGEYCVLDHNLYTFNDRACEFWEKENVLRYTNPFELNKNELKNRHADRAEWILYGYLPLMISVQCVNKNVCGCNGAGDVLELKDRKNARFPVKCFCNPWDEHNMDRKSCYNVIYNSIPFGLLKEKDQLASIPAKGYRLSFTLESPKETERIAREYLDVFLHDKQPSAHEWTKGHFKRGIE